MSILRNLVGIAYLLLGAGWGMRVHLWLFARYGRYRLARLAAYLVLGVGLGIGTGLALAWTGNGWHRLRGESVVETHWTVHEGLSGGLAVGLFVGLTMFVGGELGGGVSILGNDS